MSLSRLLSADLCHKIHIRFLPLGQKDPRRPAKGLSLSESRSRASLLSIHHNKTKEKLDGRKMANEKKLQFQLSESEDDSRPSKRRRQQEDSDSDVEEQDRRRKQQVSESEDDPYLEPRLGKWKPSGSETWPPKAKEGGRSVKGTGKGKSSTRKKA